MKFLALLMITCVILLSLFTGTVNTVRVVIKNQACSKAMCRQMCRHTKKQGANEGCNSGTCNMLFSCSQCGFLAVERIAVKANLFYVIEKPVTPYIIGILSEYHPSGWQPPEIYA